MAREEAILRLTSEVKSVADRDPSLADQKVMALEAAFRRFGSRLGQLPEDEQAAIVVVLSKRIRALLSEANQYVHGKAINKVGSANPHRLRRRHSPIIRRLPGEAAKIPSVR